MALKWQRNHIFCNRIKFTSLLPAKAGRRTLLWQALAARLAQGSQLLHDSFLQSQDPPTALQATEALGWHPLPLNSTSWGAAQRLQWEFHRWLAGGGREILLLLAPPIPGPPFLLTSQ